MLKWWHVPLYPHWINEETTIIWLVIFQIQIFKFKTNFCVCRFLLQNVFSKLINIFVFFVFILVDAFSGSMKTEDRESTKNLFTLAESNFGERNLSCTCLNFGEILFAGTKRGSSGQAVSLHLVRSGSQSEHRIRRILLARGACHIINVVISGLQNLKDGKSLIKCI